MLHINYRRYINMDYTMFLENLLVSHGMALEFVLFDFTNYEIKPLMLVYI